jgi:hypothetical protein
MMIRYLQIFLKKDQHRFVFINITLIFAHPKTKKVL